MVRAQNVILKEQCFLLFLPPLITVAIAQLVRASDCDSEGRGFEPHWLPRFRFCDRFFSEP